MDNTIELWRNRLEQQLSSGLSIKKWCEQNHISERGFYKWRKRIHNKSTSQQTVDFVPIYPLSQAVNAETLSINSTDGIIISFHGISITVKNKSDVDIAASLIKQLINL
ncbi:MAG: hypothetical protein IJE60_09890 [Tyzzerella sp.]|nr:hypothetical protein [Tyzzerella sp.]